MNSKQAIPDQLDFRAFYQEVIPTLSPGNVQATGKCPFHDDRRASLSVNLESGLWRCHAGCGSGNATTFHMKLNGVDFRTARKDLAVIAGVSEGGGRQETAAYDYTDEGGALLYQVVRYEPKDFRSRRKGPDGAWIYDLKNVRRVPYHLPELINASGAVIVEGEKDANNLKALGYTGSTVVTMVCGGANAWRDDYKPYFLSKTVAIVHDLDEPGRKFAETVAQSLHGMASSIRIITLPLKEGDGKDISDFIALRRKEGLADKEIKAELTSLIREAPAWEPKADDALKPSGLVMLDTVEPEPVEWLWAGRIPLGKLTIIDGDPGLGKSTVALDIVARVSKGLLMPDGSTGIEGGAVIISMEDGLAGTIVPRLKVAGAHLSKIAALRAVHDKDGKPRIPTVEDIEAIKRACERVRARIVVVDPLMAHLNGNVNSWRDQDVRGALTPLCKLADELGIAVIVVRHLNKTSGVQAIYRGGGTIGIIGAARCAFLVAKDPEDETRRIFAGVKNNLALLPPSLSFAIEGAENASRVSWGGISDHRADALLAIPSSPEERTALDEAKKFLKDLLANGPVETKGVQKEAKAAGIAERTLDRAKETLRVKAQKRNFAGGWEWVLPPEGCQESPKGAIKNGGTLRAGLAPFEKNEAQKALGKEPINVLEVLDDLSTVDPPEG